MRAKTSEFIKILNRAYPRQQLLLEGASVGSGGGDEVFSNEPAVFVHALGVESTGRSGLLKRRQLTALGGRKESSASSMLLPSTLSQSDFACLEKFEYSDEEEENGVMVSGDHLSG